MRTSILVLIIVGVVLPLSAPILMMGSWIMSPGGWMMGPRIMTWGSSGYGLSARWHGAFIAMKELH